jgi:hypothetical protein
MILHLHLVNLDISVQLTVSLRYEAFDLFAVRIGQLCWPGLLNPFAI